MSDLPTKEAALYSFWNSFDLPAYEENTVPDEAALPYITYQVVTDGRFQEVPLSVSVWYRSDSWVDINAKTREISEEIQSGVQIPCQSGHIWIKKGSPFAQNMGDSSDDKIKRKLINIVAEYCTRV